MIHTSESLYHKALSRFAQQQLETYQPPPPTLDDLIAARLNGGHFTADIADMWAKRPSKDWSIVQVLDAAIDAQLKSEGFGVDYGEITIEGYAEHLLRALWTASPPAVSCKSRIKTEVIERKLDLPSGTLKRPAARLHKEGLIRSQKGSGGGLWLVHAGVEAAKSL